MNATMQETEAAAAASEFPELSAYLVSIVDVDHTHREDRRHDTPQTKVQLELHAARSCPGFYTAIEAAKNELLQHFADAHDEFRQHPACKKLSRLRGDLATASEDLARVDSLACRALDDIQRSTEEGLEADQFEEAYAHATNAKPIHQRRIAGLSSAIKATEATAKKALASALELVRIELAGKAMEEHEELQGQILEVVRAGITPLVAAKQAVYLLGRAKGTADDPAKDYLTLPA